MKELTRTERISILLENYQDVESGLRDIKGTGEHVPLMCSAWNHPSYRQLDRLLVRLRDGERTLYWHLAETYFRSDKRRVLFCQRCNYSTHPWSSKNFHQHGRDNVALVPKVIRVTKIGVLPTRVTAAVAWLEKRWRGDPSLPEELLREEEAA